MQNHFNHIWLPPLNVTIFIWHVRKCVIRCFPGSEKNVLNFEKVMHTVHFILRQIQCMVAVITRTDCRSKGHEFDPGLVQYFCGD